MISIEPYLRDSYRERKRCVYIDNALFLSIFPLSLQNFVLDEFRAKLSFLFFGQST